MSITAIIKKIDPKRSYNLTNIKDEGLFPWTTDVRTIRKVVQQDMIGSKMLKTVVTNEKYGLRYQIKGSNLILFLNKYGEGFILSGKLARTPTTK